MSKLIKIGSVLAIVGLLLSGSILAKEVESLRGSQPIEDHSNQVKVNRNIADRDPIPRNYIQQPPLIPHKTKGYKINLKFNKCLTCHSWVNYKKSGATKISLTHFKNRDGDDLSNVSPRRYFCTQCHIRQTNATPLVENEFDAENTKINK